MQRKWHSLDKLQDSPNITHYSYAFGDGYGGVVVHEEDGMFEDCPDSILRSNELDRFQNSVWKIMSNSAWYRFDCYNDKYDITGVY